MLLFVSTIGAFGFETILSLLWCFINESFNSFFTFWIHSRTCYEILQDLKVTTNLLYYFVASTFIRSHLSSIRHISKLLPPISASEQFSFHLSSNSSRQVHHKRFIRHNTCHYFLRQKVNNHKSKFPPRLHVSSCHQSNKLFCLSSISSYLANQPI